MIFLTSIFSEQLKIISFNLEKILCCTNEIKITEILNSFLVQIAQL